MGARLTPHQLAISCGIFALLALAISPVLIQHWLLSSAALSAAEEQALPIWPLPNDEVAARKARLINTLLPAIEENNRILLKKRARIEQLHELRQQRTLHSNDRQWLSALAERYRVALPDDSHGAQPDDDWFATLLKHIDIIPPGLALAQGALESAWGTSRFAQEGNNYFGQWCYRKGCGIVPARRPAGARHEVQRFNSTYDSVRSYMYNLNSHYRYGDLRDIRADLRTRGSALTGVALAEGLSGYAEIDDYVEKVRAMIRANRFDDFYD